MSPEFAKLANHPGDYRWSSCKAQLSRKDDRLVKVEPLLKIVCDWKNFIRESVSEFEMESTRKHERSGRPLGDDLFVDRLESVRRNQVQKDLIKMNN